MRISRSAMLSVILMLPVMLPVTATAQVSIQDAMRGAVNDPSQTEDNRRRSEGFNEDFTGQLFDQFYSDEPGDFTDTYDEYYGPDSGYEDPYDTYDDFETADTVYDRVYEDIYSDNPDRGYTEPAAASTLDSNDRGLSANRPEEAWRRVQSAQPYGNRAYTGTPGFAIEGHDASDIDLLPVDGNGVIDVNRIPDPGTAASTNWSFEDLEKMGPCCPSGSGWLTVYSFCQLTEWDDRNNNGRIELEEQSIRLFAEGRRPSPEGACKEGPELDDAFIEANGLR